MSTAAARDLRNHTSAVLSRVAAGDRVTITVRGRAVAEIVPVRTRRPASIPRNELASLLTGRQADAGLTRVLDDLAGELTDDI